MRRSWKSRSATVGIATTLVALALVGTGVGGVAGATTPKVSANGPIQCSMSGRVTFSPALTATVRPTALKVKANLTCPSTPTGNPAVTIMSGKLSLASAKLPTSCSSGLPAPGAGKIMWKATGGKVLNSLPQWATVSTATNGTTITLDLAGIMGTGSYALENLQMHVASDAVTGGLCRKGGARGFKFSGVGGPSTFAITTPNPNGLPINHVVVLMQENRSADTYLAPLSTQGQPDYEAEPNTGNPDPTNPSGPAILPFHKTTYCEVADLDHSWNGTHAEWDNGAMDGFTAANAIPRRSDRQPRDGLLRPDRSAVLLRPRTTRSRPATATSRRRRRRRSRTGSTSWRERRSVTSTTPPAAFPVRRCSACSISTRSVGASTSSQYPLSYGSLLFSSVAAEATSRVFPISQYFTDLANGTLPSVAFVDPKLSDTPKVENDEHPPSNVQVGQAFVASIVNGLMTSSAWSTSALFLTYDEHGGFYDHVAPPAAPIPDNIPPMLKPGDTPGAFDHYGMRVPAVVISPYSKSHFVSHVVHDHTSILRFIEYRFGLPSLTNRDANADPMLEMFDFNTPTFATPPSLPAATIDPTQLAAC